MTNANISSSMLSCNNVSCRTSLSSGPVWVTECGHIFCDQCGTHSKSRLACIYCRASLGIMDSDSIVRKKSLNPDPKWKKMVLAGLPPDVVMEICSSAIQFYQRQAMEEVNYLEEKVKRVKDRVEFVKDYYEGVIVQFKMEIGNLEAKLAERSSSSASASVSTFHTAKSSSDSSFYTASTGEGEMQDLDWTLKDTEENSFEMQESGGSIDFLNESSPSFLNLGLPDFRAETACDARPYKLVRTEITEQSKVKVDGQDVLLMKRCSVLDNLNNTKTITRTAQSSNSQLHAMLLGRLVGGNTKNSQQPGHVREHQAGGP